MYITIADPDAGRYPIGTWGPGSAWDLRGYIKSIGGDCFLWLDNSFALADIDGGWSTAYVLKVGTASYDSDVFPFGGYTYGAIGERKLQFVCYDTATDGAIYFCDDEVFSSLPVTGNTKEVKGYTWTELEYSLFYLRYANDQAQNHHNEDDSSMYTDVTGEVLQSANFGFWIAKTENGAFLLIENGLNIGIDSDRFELYWTTPDTLRHAVIYYVAKWARSGVDLGQLVTLADFS